MPAPRKHVMALTAAVMVATFEPRLLNPAPSATLCRPTPLTAAEERSPAAAALARQFNPSMAFTSDDVWPVEVRYAWRDGADLRSQVLDSAGRVVTDAVAVRSADLERRSWADLPSRDAAGHRIRYVIDMPGDDGDDRGGTRWRQRWRHLVGRDQPDRPPSASEFPPTQYAHLFWYNRDEGLLGIQYWFFYPFNDWVNRHEGDWEHINVILRGPQTLDAPPGAFQSVAYQFFFHGWRYETRSVVRVRGAAPGDDHVVVFTGGRGRLLWWTGTQSGASYPLPAVFRGVGEGPLRPDEDTRRPARFIHARDFRVIVLPEPERLDADAHPELSWMRLDFYAGQEQVRRNPPLVNLLGFGGPTLQPARRSTWNARATKPAWPGPLPVAPAANPLPAAWQTVAGPWASSLR